MRNSPGKKRRRQRSTKSSHRVQSEVRDSSASASGRDLSLYSSAIQLQATAGNRAVAALLNSSNEPQVPETGSIGYTVPVNRLPERAGGKRLPVLLQTEMQRTFDANFENIRVHENAEIAQDINSNAFTLGTHIHFAPGKYAPHSGMGRTLIAHELTHVLQQSSGRVQAPADEGGLPVNNQAHFEQEAQRAGRHAAWRLPVRVQGAKRAMHRPAKMSAQTDEG